MKKVNLLSMVLVGILLVGCNEKTNTKKKIEMKTFEKGTFGYDLNYLSQKDHLVVLSDSDDDAQIIVSPKYQGKVFTSTAEGLGGNSLGFVNYKVLDAQKQDEHMNGYGGENRFWLGPEGGQFSIYFKPNAPQVFDNWHTPKPIDVEAWKLVSFDKKKVCMSKQMVVPNYKGISLSLLVNRSIELMTKNEAEKALGIKIGKALKMVAYNTDNAITNENNFAWTKTTGTVCIWMLDMFNPAPHALTIIPYHVGDEQDLGVIATTNYFGEIPSDRLKIDHGIIYLKTDGKNRNKLGLNAKRTKGIAANYDPATKRLTIVTSDVDKNATYLNQEWKPAKDPLKGDAMNAYNDGPLEDGSIMGPFLEVESVSPAAFLAPNESLKHNHKVFHFVGDEAALSVITEQLLGVSINQIKTIFN